MSTIKVRIFLTLIFTTLLLITPSSAYVNDFEYQSASGEKLSISEFATEIVLVDFMATWCKPCHIQLPELKQFNLANPEIVILSIGVDNIDDTLEKIIKYYDDNNVTWHVGFDSDGVLMDLLDFPHIPTLMLFDEAGNILKRWFEFIDASTLESEISELLSTHATTRIIRNFFENNRQVIPVVIIIVGALLVYSLLKVFRKLK